MASRADYATTLQTHNPVAYWQFPEAASSPVPYILTNSGTLGSVANAYAIPSLVNGVAGKVNNCIRMSDTSPVALCDSRADVVWNAGLNSPVFSVEFWANPGAQVANGDSTGLCPLSNFSPNGGVGSSRIGWLFYVPPSGVWNFRMGLTSGYAVNLHATTGNATIGTWQHICATYDGNTANLYINGVLAGTLASSAAVTGWVPNPNSFLRFGGTPLVGSTAYVTADQFYYLPLSQGSTVCGNRGWDGLLDEVAIYTNVLSAAQVLAHYNAASTPATYGATILADHPSGYWNFDEPAVTVPSSFPTAANSGTAAADATGTNLWGAVNGQPGPGYGGFPASDKAVSYDGVYDSMAVGDAPALHISNNISLVAWVKPLANNYVHDIIEHGPDGTGQETFLRVTRAPGVGNYGQASYYEVGSTIGENGDNFYDGLQVPMPPGDIGNWVFLVGTFDGTQWNLYRNGALAGTLAPDLSDTGAVDVTKGWSVGSRQLPSPWDGNRFAGTIAEPAILTNALSAADVLALYNAAQVPPVITRAVHLPPGPFGLGIYKNNSAEFDVWAEGNATLNYLWYSNGISTGVTATNYTINTLNAGSLTIAVVVTNSYGSITSSVSTTIIASRPLIAQQPVAVTRFAGRPFSFSVTAAGTAPIGFQWKTNGVAIPGATSSTYSATASPSTAGSYSCTLSNEAGTSNTISVAMTSLAIPPGYAAGIIAAAPLGYWRLDETNGTVCHDYYNGNDGAYNSVTLGQPGYSIIDPDTCGLFSGAVNSDVGNISGTAINFPGHSVFTLECWANGAPGQGDQATLIGKGIGNNGTTRNEQFALDLSGGNYHFFTSAGTAPLVEVNAGVGPDNTWQHIVAVYDDQNTLGGGSNMYLYVNGELQGTSPTRALGVVGTTSVVSFGSKRTGTDPNYDGSFAGFLDEIAIYPYALSQSNVLVHYAAAYGPSLPPLITVLPQSISNYAGLNASISVGAGGTQPLSYQWKKGGSPLSDGPTAGGSIIGGTTTEKLSITNLVAGVAGDSGSYSVTITNVNGVTNSPAVQLTVLTPPTSPPAIPGLVMHMPFNGSLQDVTGRGNNAVGIHIKGYLSTNAATVTSNVLAPTYVTDGMPTGTNMGMHFQTTDLDGGGTNFENFYATLGTNPPDLQFGTVGNFSVALWIRPPANYVLNDLPYFCDGAGSTFATPGIVFAYTYGTAASGNAAWPGGWAVSVLDAANGGLAGRGEIGSINDGSWHHLVHVFDRKNGAVTYLDGLEVPLHKQAGTSIQAAGSFDNPSRWWTIGQDPTGLYASATAGPAPESPGTQASGDIDDLGVWKKALTPLEAASLYIAAVSNKLSFVGAPLSFTFHRSGNSLILTWNAGVLQSSSSAQGPYTDLTGESPLTVPMTGTGAAKQQFYRVHL
jgi:hypothetical protein